MRNMNVFDVKTLRAKGGIDKETGYKLDGDYFGLPWPCYGTPEMKHPGSPNLYDTAKHVMDGGGNFRANFGVEKRRRQPARRGRLAFEGRRDHHRLPRVRPRAAEEARLVGRADRAGEGRGRGQELEDRPLRRHPARGDEEHGCHPFGNAKARAVVWNFPDPMPQHREPLYSTRPDLVAKYPTHDDKKAFWRLPTLYKSVQEKNKDIGKTVPADHDRGRLVEYEGGGEETRSNPWLAELQQEMFVEINPTAANDRGIRNGEYVWVKTPTGAKHQGARRWSPSASDRDTVLHAVPLLGPLAGRRPAAVLPGRRARRSCAARRSTPRRPTATTA